MPYRIKRKRIDKRRFYSLIGLFNIGVGIMFIVIHAQPDVPVLAYAAPTMTVKEIVQPQTIPAVTGTPTRLVIPSLAIDLTVNIGSYNPQDDGWTIDAVNAYYADVSLPVNDSNGVTLIYGHAQWPVFGALPSIQVGAEALVYTDTGRVFRYRYTSMKEVVPTDTSVFSASGPPTLVLQTCIGDWDAYRALFAFTFESEEKL